jgi:hypothetical protein
MKTNEKEQIEKLLDSYHSLSECVIETISLSDYGTTVEVVFNYIWDEEGNVRGDLERPKELVLRFRIVQEFHLANALNAYMCEFPREINWGLNEISRAALLSDDSLNRYGSLPIPFQHMVFYWEGERRLDIIFSELEILQRW